MPFRIQLTETAASNIRSIRNPVIREQVTERIEILSDNPGIGKPLRGPLSRYRSLRAARNRYHIIYRVEKRQVVVIIVAVGIRKGKDRDDIYQELQRIIKRTGHLESESNEENDL